MRRCMARKAGMMVQDSTSKIILVVDDEAKIVDVVRSVLESRNYRVLAAENGRQALEIFNREPVDLILLDLMLPEISGQQVCKAIRMKSRVPIIMLTARAEESDELEGLDIGADDYITKPFSLKMLIAHVEAVLRRTAGGQKTEVTRLTYCRGDLRLDLEQRVVLKEGREIRLTPHEYKILAVLASHPGKTFTRDELILAAFSDDFEGFDRTVDSHIKNIRQKIETDPKNPCYILTIHGVGYKFGGK